MVQNNVIGLLEIFGRITHFSPLLLSFRYLVQRIGLWVYDTIYEMMYVISAWKKLMQCPEMFHLLLGDSLRIRRNSSNKSVKRPGQSWFMGKALSEIINIKTHSWDSVGSVDKSLVK